MKPASIRLLALLAALAASAAVFFVGIHTLGALLHFAVVGFALWGTLSPYSRLFGPIVTHTNGDFIWLTIDDGPHPEDTPRILDLLDKFGAKATFFVIGERAKAHPELVREIQARGHEAANHTWSHPQAKFWRLGPGATRREILRCQEFLTELLGKPPRFFRAPVGHFNLFTHPALAETGLQLASWSSRGFDGVATAPQKVLALVKATLAPGKILLLHEGRPHSVANLEAVLQYAAERGWSFRLP
jgi:peptidoglycan-N-acetylglucosamine deacetylase